ncbi:acyl-CoA dehydrogenase family protein [Yinghuangia soli]|uniref:Acyl-CoA dehydrogenase family protein n=1 Tax=Yinghuangia soli TaxID=2908204 RepID=A0AA41Q3S7_9ACTN|nr:acyl-CoA dehydrogenase family protein [Yinghuangia soli]MCF2531003.1 acyl-CoA dehydrogenase family protein [Yinghuangia soli]
MEDHDHIRARVRDLVARHDLAGMTQREFLGHRFDAGLAWVHAPAGCGGLGLSRALQPVVEEELAAAGVPRLNLARNPIGLGMGAPTVLAHGTDGQRARLLRPLWTGEEVWCQLFSEPGAGSDLAGLATRAVRDGDAWVVDGQKVWTSLAHHARWAMLLARTDPQEPKHRGMTYFVLDMQAPGVEVLPLRQATGQAEFNEVFLTGVRIPDTMRLGDVGQGWTVATTTLMNERVAIGGAAAPREGGPLGELMRLWRDRPELRTPGLHHRLLRLWARAEAARIGNERTRQANAAGKPGPEGSAAKLAYAGIAQDISRLHLELTGPDALGYDDWTFRRSEMTGSGEVRHAGFHYLRTRANSIEGGTNEVLRGVIADRVLDLPREPRTDTKLPWKDVPR